jgi:hypothetical protein
MIFTSHLIGDLAADRLRTLHEEARRYDVQPAAAEQRTALLRRWSWTRMRKPDPQPPHRQVELRRPT